MYNPHFVQNYPVFTPSAPYKQPHTTNFGASLPALHPSSRIFYLIIKEMPKQLTPHVSRP
jgi:hypothetical protein